MFAWRQVSLLMLLSGAVPSVTALALIWTAPPTMLSSAALRWTLTVTVLIAWLVMGYLVRERLVERLRTFGNIVAALREQDYSVRAAGANRSDPLGEIALELNALANELRDHRHVRREGQALLEKVLSEVDAAMFAFDADGRVRLVNESGAALVARTPAELVGVSARIVGLDRFLTGDTPRVEDASLSGRTGRWEIRRTAIRQDGRPHTLLVIHDLSRTLAAEERAAWKRLIQVLRHEINNSLAPIQSIASTLRDKLSRDAPPENLDRDLSEGLDVIGSRAEALTRLTASYARLTRLPSPALQTLALETVVRRVVALEQRLVVDVEGGPQVELSADPDQLEQILINLVSNAVEACAESGGGVRIRWALTENTSGVEVTVEDDGPGIADTENLFVPFFTTKPNGTGIGLVLSRQIAEAHGGRLTLENRPGGGGCQARLLLPIGRD